MAGARVVLCVLQAVPGGPEPLNPGAEGLGEGARGWWDVSVEQESPEEFVCFPCTSEQRVPLSLAALWLGPGGAGLQHRAAALPQARHGDGTGRACPAVREQPSRLRSCCCFEQSVLRSPGQVSVPETGSVGEGFGGSGDQALAGGSVGSVMPRKVLVVSLPSDFGMLSLFLGPCHHPVCLGAVAQQESRGLCLLIELQ